MFSGCGVSFVSTEIFGIIRRKENERSFELPSNSDYSSKQAEFQNPLS